MQLKQKIKLNKHIHTNHYLYQTCSFEVALQEVQSLQMAEQTSHRKQLHQFAIKLTKQGHNIKAFQRRKSMQHNNSTHKLLQHTLTTDIGKDEAKNSNNTVIKHHSAQKNIIFPQRYTKRIVPNKRKKSHVTDYNHTNYTQNFITRVNTNYQAQLIIKHEERQNASQKQINREKYTSSERKLENMSTYSSKQQEIFKNRILNDSHLENWINQVLIERCPDQKFDKNIVNPAIKKYQVDKNSLLSYGVSQANISRVLKSLFVYSIGFNNLISQISNKNIQIKKNIWKVFSILIEYCSQGTIQTVVSQIQKQNETQQETLKKEIEKQQRLIQNCENLNKKKNEMIFKQNNELKAKNEQLQLDRHVLVQSNQEHQRAFTEEISLRLMFESKISDLHSLYRELQLKHHKLFSDFQLKINQLTYFKDKASYYHNQNVILRKEKAALEDDIQERNHQIRQLNESIIKLKKELNDQFLVDSQRRIQKKINDNLLKQKEIKESQLTYQLKTIEMSLNAHEKSHQTLRDEYYRSLDENNRLITKLNNELADITQRLMNQKELNGNNAHFLAQINCLSLKINEKVLIMSNMEQLTKANFHKIEKLELQIQTKDEQIATLQQNIKANYDTIANLKLVNTQFEQNNIAAQKINDNLERNAKELIRKIQLQKDQTKQWRKKYEHLLLQLQKLQNKYQMLSQQIPKIQTKCSSNMAHIQQSLKEQKEKRITSQAQLTQKRIQMKMTRQAFDSMEQKYKSEKFQRDSLEYRYKHSLGVFQNTQVIVKNQNSAISELQRNLQQVSLNLKLANSQYARLEKKYIEENEEHTKKVQQIESKLKNSHCFVHPMLIQDINEHYRRLQNERDSLKVTLSIWKEEYQQKKFAMQEKISRIQQHYHKKQNQFIQKMKKKELQIEYQHSRQKQFTERIDYLQITLKAKQMAKEEVQPQRQSFKQKQKRYLQVISQNYFKINTLVSDLEQIQNHNQQLIVRIQSTQKELQKSKQIIVGIQHEKQELKEVNYELIDERGKFQEIKNELINEINQKESLINTYIPQYKSLRQSPSQKRKVREKSPVNLRKTENQSHLKRKVSLMEPIISQIREREERQDTKKLSQKSSYQNEDWRADFTTKLKSSFSYYH